MLKTQHLADRGAHSGTHTSLFYRPIAGDLAGGITSCRIRAYIAAANGKVVKDGRGHNRNRSDRSGMP